MVDLADAIEALKNKGLVLKIAEGLQDYLSCKDKKRAWLGWPHLIKNMEKKSGELVQDVQSHKTHGTPKLLIVRPTVKSKKISGENQQDYFWAWECYCTLLNTCIPTLPTQPGDCQKQTKVQTLWTTRHFYMLSGMSMKNVNKTWEMIFFYDSHYAGNPVSRQSIIGFVRKSLAPSKSTL